MLGIFMLFLLDETLCLKIPPTLISLRGSSRKPQKDDFSLLKNCSGKNSSNYGII